MSHGLRYGRSKRSFCGPPSCKTRTYGASCKAVKAHPILQAPALSGKLQDDVVRLVSRLLACGCPSAILRLIPAIIIDPVDRHSFRGFSHICKKIGKDGPTIAHSHASTAVPSIVGRVRIGAPLQHGVPDLESARCRLPVSASGLACLLCLKASTGLRKTFPQAVSNNLFGGAAIASTLPKALALSSASATDDRKASESSSRKVYCFHRRAPA